MSFICFHIGRQNLHWDVIYEFHYHHYTNTDQLFTLQLKIKIHA
jgi:hypothetical protein